MPPKKTGKKKQISYASVSLSAGKGVGSDLDEELLALPTLKTSRGMLALALALEGQAHYANFLAYYAIFKVLFFKPYYAFAPAPIMLTLMLKKNK